MISDTAASFIVLQKQFSGVVWVFLPTIILLKLLLTSVTIEGGQGLFNLIKGCFYSVIILIIFNYFYPSFIGVIDNYLNIEPIGHKANGAWEAFWSFAAKYSIGAVAVFFHAISSMIMLFFLTVVTVSFSISYALYAIFGYDGLWKITVKCTLAVLMWTCVMYFVKSDISAVNGVSEESAAAFFTNALGAAFLSALSTIIAFQYESIINKAKEISDQYNKRLEYESQKEKVEEDIRNGNVDYNQNTGQMVLKNDYRDPTGDALRAHQSKLIDENPNEAKKYGLKTSNWGKFEEEVNSKVNLDPKGYSELTTANSGFKESLETQSESSTIKPDSVSLPKGLNPYRMQPNKIVSNDNHPERMISDIPVSSLLTSTPLINKDKKTIGYNIETPDERAISINGQKLIKNKKGNYLGTGNTLKLEGIEELIVNGNSFYPNTQVEYDYFNSEESPYYKEIRTKDKMK